MSQSMAARGEAQPTMADSGDFMAPGNAKASSAVRLLPPSRLLLLLDGLPCNARPARSCPQAIQKLAGITDAPHQGPGPDQKIWLEAWNGRCAAWAAN